MSDRAKVRAFLQSVKETISTPVAGSLGWILVSRQDNKECLLQLAFRYQDISEILLNLSVEDYYDGPCQDRDQLGELWVFGKVIEGKDIYIKIKLASFGSLRVVRIISFHFARQQLAYPFKEGKIQKEAQDDK